MSMKGFESSNLYLGIMKATCIQRPLGRIRKDLRSPKLSQLTLRTDLEAGHKQEVKAKAKL